MHAPPLHDPGAVRHRDLLSLEDEFVSFDEHSQLVGQEDGALAGRLGKDEHELFAAIAREAILAADAALHEGRDLAQDVVTGEMPEVVVDPLETVDVHEHQGESATVPGTAGHLPFEELEQVTLVVDLGEPIDDGEPVDLLVILRLD